VPYVWGKEQAETFQTLKDILCSEPLLQYLDFKKGCDASSTGIGRILSQGPLGHDLPVAYASVLTKAEKNYYTIERELTAIVCGCKQLMQYIWGRKFAIVTYHKPLAWIFKMNDPSSRIMRLKLKLQEFDYTIVYRKGKENGNSDGLSRMFSEAVSEGAIINALTGEAEEVGMKPDSVESGITKGKRKSKDESETVCRDLTL